MFYESHDILFVGCCVHDVRVTLACVFVCMCISVKNPKEYRAYIQFVIFYVYKKLIKLKNIIKDCPSDAYDVI